MRLMRAFKLGISHGVILASIVGPFAFMVTSFFLEAPLIGAGILLFFGYPVYTAYTIVARHLREEKLETFAKWHKEAE